MQVLPLAGGGGEEVKVLGGPHNGAFLIECQYADSWEMFLRLLSQ